MKVSKRVSRFEEMRRMPVDRLEHLDSPAKDIGLSDAIIIYCLLASVPSGFVTWLLVFRGINVGQDQTYRHSQHQRQ